MRSFALISVLVSLLAVSVASGTARSPNVKGVVVRATGGGGCYQGEPCDPLPPATYVVFSRGSVATRSKLAANGSFSIHLAPGRYTVTVAPPHGLLTPATLAVPRVGTLHPRLVERHR